MNPTKYLPEYCDDLYEHMSEGLSFESFAKEVGVGTRTIYDWADRHEEFQEAKERGYAAGLYFWERLSREAAKGLIPGFNATVWIFWMKNRFGWRDKTEDQEKASANFIGEALAKHLTPEARAKLRLVARDNKKK